jgi:hypothetical protein
MEESIAEKSTRRKAQQDFQKWLLLVSIFERYKEQHDNRSSADNRSRAESLEPQPQSGVDSQPFRICVIGETSSGRLDASMILICRSGILVNMPVVVFVVCVTMTSMTVAVTATVGVAVTMIAGGFLVVPVCVAVHGLVGGSGIFEAWRFGATVSVSVVVSVSVIVRMSVTVSFGIKSATDRSQNDQRTHDHKKHIATTTAGCHFQRI